MSRPRVLVTGATGYVGGRLVPRLLEAGYRVRTMSRDAARLSTEPWADAVEIVQADVLDPDSLQRAFAGVDAAYYLVHSMGSTADFADADLAGAANFRDAAAEAGVGRIVYLGGLGDDRDVEGDELSAHLASRHDVGRTLREGQVPVIELRAAVIIGSGSVSFEMLRYLTEVLPVMTTPRWVRTRCQPIAIRDVLHALLVALETEPRTRVVEIGGPDVLTYEQMMQAYAEVAGLRKRLIVPVPVLSPGLSSRWIGLVTPLPVGVARPLVDSLRNEVVVRDRGDPSFLPPDPLPFREAVRLALERVADDAVETRWTDAAADPARPLPSDPSWAGGTRFEDRREVRTHATPADVFWAVRRIGGANGYYGFGWAWRLRGLLDKLIGGVGLRRGRRHPEHLRVGEALDFWRVRALEPDRRLLLEAEMRLPGRAWLGWEVAPTPDGDTRLVQTATFLPRGLLGRLYWAALVPFHGPIFSTMARRIVETAERRRVGPTAPPLS